MRSFTALSAIALFFTFGLQASAHGTPSKISIAGTEYGAANGASVASDSPWRKVQSGDPVKDETSDAIICGTDAQTATNSAKANPGDQMQIWWQAESGGGNWFHTVGPILSYLAECTSDCASFTPDASTEWFKIDEQGLSNGAWVQASLTQGNPVTVTLPSNVKPGNYLLRHEIIALQGAQSLGGAEFYPACAQLTIGGSGSGTPNTTVHFPGAYSATDPGIEVDAYTNLVSYTFPGGPVANLGGSGSGSSSGSGSDGSSSAFPSSGSGSGVTPAASQGGASTSTSLGGVGSSSLPTGAGALPTSTSTPANSTGNADSGSGATGKCASKKFKLKRRDQGTLSSSSNGAKKRHAQKMQRKRSNVSTAFNVATN